MRQRNNRTEHRGLDFTVHPDRLKRGSDGCIDDGSLWLWTLDYDFDTRLP